MVRATSTEGAEIGNITDNGDGSYTAKMTATAAGVNTITAKADGVTITTTPTITTTAPAF